MSKTRYALLSALFMSAAVAGCDAGPDEPDYRVFVGDEPVESVDIPFHFERDVGRQFPDGTVELSER